MSIKRMSAVWEHSQHKGNDLLLLLALADNAADDGYCWPSIDTLAQKTRLSTATVIRRTRQLEKSGELFVQHNRRAGNKYLVIVGLEMDAIQAAMETRLSMKPDDISCKLQVLKECRNPSDKLQIATSEVAQLCNIRTSTAMQHDPSITINEPSKDSADATAPQGEPVQEKEPAKPKHPKPRDPVFDAIAVQLFNADLADKPAVEAIGGRVGKIRAKLKTMEVTLVQFREACQWYRQANPEISMPRDPEKAASMIIDYRASQSETAAATDPKIQTALERTRSMIHADAPAMPT